MQTRTTDSFWFYTIFIFLGRKKLLLLLYLIPNFLESLNIVVVFGFLAVVDNSNLLVFYRGFYFLCALYEANVTLDFLLTVLAVHLRLSGYYQCVG